MKHKIFVSLLIGIILTAISLLKISGAAPPMVPCAGVGPNCVTGVVVSTPVLRDVNAGHRGYPLPIMYLNGDEDGNSIYQGYAVGYTIADLAIYSLLAFIVLGAYQKFVKRKTSKSGTAK